MIQYHFSFNLQDPRIYDSDMEFVSGDVGAYGVRISFLSDGMSFDISEYTFVVKVVRADKTVLDDAGYIEDNKAVYVFKNSMLSVPGDVVIEFALTDAQGNYITAKIVRATVLQGAGDGNNASDTTNVYASLLGQLTERLNQANKLLAALDVDLTELFERPTFGGMINSAPPKEAKAGTYYIASSDFADKGIRYSGLLPDMFKLDGAGAGNIDMAYNILFKPDSRCIGPVAAGYPSDGRLAVYSTDGKFAGYIDYNPTLDTMPMYLDLTKLGVTSASDYVEFYLGFYDGNAGKEFPTVLTIVDAGTLLVDTNGKGNFRTYITTSAVDRMVGKIDEALDAILKMDADILGGDA